MDSSKLIRTKFHKPNITADLVERPRLVEQLNKGVERRLTLVSAPAGYGKSTLISAWLEQCSCPSAWLSLDEYDNDLVFFLNYFIAAIQTLFPETCQETVALIRAPELPPLRVLTTTLINELASVEKRFVIVLDDYHSIRKEAIHDFLAELLRHPPQALHLVLTTRADPPFDLLILRARGQALVMRAGDLRFSSAETAELLQNLLGFDVQDDLAQTLSVRTEGWITGMRLSLLSVHGVVDLERIKVSLPGERDTTNYLVAEAISRQPPVIQDWLLKSATLDRFCAPLCEVVCAPLVDQEVRDLKGQDFLNWLERNNMFVISLDDQHQWYRYHHLFQQILRRQAESKLGEQGMAALHCRAGDWFAQNGFVEEALHHALAGGDTEGAIALVAQHRHDRMNRERWRDLERWLHLFPTEVVEGSIELLLLRSWLCYLFWYKLGDLDRNLDLVETLIAENLLAESERVLYEGELAAMRSALLYWRIRGVEAEATARYALEVTPRERECAHSMALLHLAGAHQVIGKTDEALQELWQALHTEIYLSPSAVTTILLALCFVHWLQGNLHGVIEAATRIQRISEEHDMPGSLSYAHYFLGIAHYERNELVEAEEHLSVLLQKRYLFPMQNVAQGIFPLAFIYQAQGRADKAREAQLVISELAFERRNALFMEMAEALKAKLNLRGGRIAEAVYWSKGVKLGPLLAMHRFYLPELTLAKILLAEDTVKSYEQAADLLSRLLEHGTSIHNVRVQIEVLALQALLYDVQGDAQAALQALERALRLSEPGGWIRVYVDLGPPMVKLLMLLGKQGVAPDYIAQIQAAFTDTPKASISATQDQLIEPLSERELEVLALLAQRLANKEIAAELVLTPGTVKQHNYNIYQKLNAKGRREAVEKAEALGLLPVS